MANPIKSNPIVKYAGESKSELQKVTWPSRKMLLNHTLVVIGLCVGVALFIAGVDYLLNLGVEYLLK